MYGLDLPMIKHYTEGEGADNISNNDIFCVKKDSKGNILIGTNGFGVDIYDPLTGKFSRLVPDKIKGSCCATAVLSTIKLITAAKIFFIVDFILCYWILVFARSMI